MKRKVGRTPWSAADAHVGLLLVLIDARISRSRGTRADQGQLAEIQPAAYNSASA